jgi:iron complex outermembrane receptor protein
VYSDQKLRTDSLNAYSQNIYGSADTTAYPLAPNGYSVTPCCITFGSVFDEKKRTALSGKIEFKPVDGLKIGLDGLWTHLQDPQIGYNQSYYFPYTEDNNGVPTWSNPTIDNGLVTGVTSSAFAPELVNNTTNRNVTSSMYGLKVEWDPIDSVSLVFDGYRSVAYRPEGGQDTFVTAGLVSQSPVSPDLITVTDTRGGFPNLNVAIPPSQLGLTACPNGTASSTNAGYCSYTSLMNSGFLNNNKYWSTHYDGLNGYSVHDQVTGFSLDGAWKADLGLFRKLQFGVNETYRVKSRTDISNDWTNGSGQYGSLYTTAGCPVQCTPYDFASQGFNVISINNVPNFMNGAGGSFPSVVTQINTNQLLAFMQSLNGKANPLYCTALPCDTTFDFSQTLPQVNPQNSYSVRERTTSFYLEGVFGDGERWSGNAGVRVVHTTTSALTSQSVPTAVWALSTANATQTFNVVYSDLTAFSENASYTYALPSLNFSYWLVPKELQLRVAGSETLARPDLNQLAPNATNQAINGTPDLAYTGTAGLKPIKSWNGDLSLEWYYHPHSAFTGAFFYKKVVNDIITTVTPDVDLGTTQYIGGPPGTVPGTPFLWSVSAPANGGKAIYTGIEFSWQHFLDMGLGTHMQVTHTWTKGYDQDGNPTGAINTAPPTTFSASLIYDKGPFNADINWDWTSRYTYACSDCTEVPSWPAIQDPFSWVTASLHYRLFEGLEVYVEGKNLTNAIPRTYLNGNKLLPWAPGQAIGQSASGTGAGYSAYGRTYVFGASYRF